MTTSSLAHLYSKSACCAVPSAIREINKLVDLPDMKSLAGGWPDPAVFPGKDIGRIAAEQLSKNADQVLQYGTTEGLADLRHELAKLAARRYGIKCTPDHIVLTHGSAQGMDLACRVMIDPDDVVFVGLPTYFGGTGSVMACCGELLGVEIDDDGINTHQMADQLQVLKNSGKRAKGIYVIAKQFVDVATNSLAQYILLEFIRSGLLEKRIELNNQYYKRKRDFMLEQLETHFPSEVQWNRPEGGFFIFVKLPVAMDASELLTDAVKHNVAFVAGAPFFIDQSGNNTFRLSYSQSSESVIAAALAELGRLIKKRLSR